MRYVCVLVMLGGTLLGSCLQIAAAPANNITSPFFALKFKGEDTSMSACQYYKAIGAVSNCGPAGELIGPSFNFDEWKRRNGLAVNPDVDGNGTAFDLIDQVVNLLTHGEVSALYLNAVDLNLGRAMHGRRDQDRVAYYVCNYMTIEDARLNRGLLACVAMDYSAVSPAVNNGLPFTKFYVFNKDGNLVPSVALDFQGPKFVPGLCVACHGGDNYPQDANSSARGVGFPEDGTGTPDIGGHFLPFDLDNFEYSNSPRFTRKAQEAQFRHLNQLIFDTNIKPVVEQLLKGWYPSGHGPQQSQFVPPGWDLNQDPQDPSAQFSPRELYLEVVKPSCRTCHIVMSDNLNWNRYTNIATDDPRTPPDDTQGGFKDLAGTIQGAVCSGKNSYMPNAEVTLNLFWEDPLQPDLLTRFLRVVNDPTIVCPEPAP
jgi:hypothetical protein